MTDLALDLAIARALRICGHDLDALIAQGWGETPQTQIPADWRTRRGPDVGESRTRGARISRALRWSARYQPWRQREQEERRRECEACSRRRTEREQRKQQRQERIAAEMRGKYWNPIRIAAHQREYRRRAKR